MVPCSVLFRTQSIVKYITETVRKHKHYKTANHCNRIFKNYKNKIISVIGRKMGSKNYICRIILTISANAADKA